MVVGGGGTYDAVNHPHTNIVWTSTDDGETWTDHSGGEELVSHGVGAAATGTSTGAHSTTLTCPSRTRRAPRKGAAASPTS